ncbi:Short-chain dehydrogenase/reductase SDR [Rhodopseudomonas palustris HaA2]|uniref:Short-chain dehydrogenase/reductase SDR n=1 Tax=Rhodopseudomonas palustris (strain HaA2) TaxID=316058 RepID=Q2IVI5_RHOP2|nr:SDR family oxidoreductase [Rhodopseudomonas palustris]ABD07775.1 Short-chain dehydrogenase/reductase SDR [Rhodopseudomonas palustris HaA2]
MSGALVGKTALVTGSSRGIGRAIAIAAAREGAVVGVHYAGGADAAGETLDAIRAGGGDGFLLQADLSERGGPDALAAKFLDEVEQRTGQRSFDLLVNNAGYGGRYRIDQVDDEIFDRMIAVNFRAPFFLTRALHPAIRDGGRIVNVSSMGTRAAFPDMSIYAPSKAALETLSVVLAKQLGRRGITVNAVLPGATVTDMNPLDKDQARAAAATETITLQRLGRPNDIAGVVLMLLSDAGGWITGQRIDASGGQRL